MNMCGLQRLKIAGIGMLLLFWLGAVTARSQTGAVNITGIWEVSVTSQEGTAHPTLSLRQDGEKITGTYSGKMGDADLEGTLRGSDIRLIIAIKFQDAPHTVIYTGKVTESAMKGTVRFANGSSGNWSAKRRESQE